MTDIAVAILIVQRVIRPANGRTDPSEHVVLKGRVNEGSPPVDLRIALETGHRITVKAKLS